MIRRRHQLLPSFDLTRLDYYDVTWFLLAVAFIAFALHAGIAVRLLPARCLTSPSIPTQSAVMVALILSLAITVALRDHRSPAMELGWRLASAVWLAGAVTTGSLMAIAVALIVGQSYPLVPTMGLADGIVLAVVWAPFLEESFFRGCLLPVVARSAGPFGAVILTSLIFGLFHHPPTLLHLTCFTLAGCAYARFVQLGAAHLEEAGAALIWQNAVTKCEATAIRQITMRVEQPPSLTVDC